MRCLSCHERFFPMPSWESVLLLKEEEPLCQMCAEQLVALGGEGCCSTCSRHIHTHYQREGVCLDCWRWEQQEYTKGLLTMNRSLYEYNSFLKEWLAVYKFRGDAIVASYFAKLLSVMYHHFFQGDLVVPVPLSEKRLKARGFNQASLIMEGWAEDHDVLARVEGEKQSKKSRKQRISQVTDQPFRMNEQGIELVRGRSIVLVDDIYTTGTTVRQVARLLKEAGAQKVSSMTVGR
ncbi:ComF family protein [Halalkalibacter hemicellulosilyticus]|uniref:Competence protein F homolog n=1 Tax=Halalkalibacter hemicellulosilyticusJCM 9152 TaxID=1236971 RepID=W4QLJ0_9BACI|nr:ComF family protein [Halalkalibacter hemicellulosilyticus]GAE32777.1 competence protein F homolog [Halalkalibacter hemicellulosilyticusJCM 9152]